jgi:hypothetical protein
MGCQDHPDAGTLRDEPKVAVWICVVDRTKGEKPNAGCQPVKKPWRDAPPAACNHCKKEKVKTELIGAHQFFCTEPGCYVQII